MKRRFSLLAAIISIGSSSWCFAQTVSYSTASNLNVAIPDDAYNGTLASMAAVNLNIPDSASLFNVNVTIALDHTYVGDLVIKLRSPDGTVVTLMSRPGFAETADDGNGCCGNSSNLLAAFAITFYRFGVVSAENMGSSLMDSQVVSRDDGISVYRPNKGAASGGDLDTFIGKNINGTWTLFVGDAAVGDTGAIQQLTLTFDANIPEPSTVALLLVGGAFVALRLVRFALCRRA